MLCMPVKDSDGNVLAVVQALNKARVHVTSVQLFSFHMLCIITMNSLHIVTRSIIIIAHDNIDVNVN
jgi:hypothetical protein